MISVQCIVNVGTPVWRIFTDPDCRKGKDVGCALVTELKAPTGTAVLLAYIFVWPSKRRSGIGSMIIKYLQGHQQKGILYSGDNFAGYDIISTQWSASTPASRKMLKKLGFVKKDDRLEWSRLETASSTQQEPSEQS